MAGEQAWVFRLGLGKGYGTLRKLKCWLKFRWGCSHQAWALVERPGLELEGCRKGMSGVFRDTHLGRVWRRIWDVWMLSRVVGDCVEVALEW